VEIEPLLPRELAGPGSFDELREGLRRHDRAFAARVEAARGRGRVLRYLAEVDVARNRVRVGPVEVEPSHRAARLREVEAYVAVTSDLHAATPMVVQGTGVGGALSAGAVLTDVLRVAAALGVRASWSG
jgi:aspartokinase/homoserine dehydrogenase 1